MGFFGKKDRPEDAIENASIDSDTEKQMPSHEDEYRNAVPDIPVVEVDPVVEKRLLRKLDWRVPMLLGFLCMCTFVGILRDLSNSDQMYCPRWTAVISGMFVSCRVSK